ncbi:hypothetical protein HDV00_011787 [Rhizophlyctis rosea]|nr:hypothetical protein HDV00_011787 [Rhizophlyctis rosea]
MHSNRPRQGHTVSLFLLATLVPLAQAQWSLLGCYGQIFGNNDWGTTVSVSGTPIKAFDCVSACTNNRASYVLIRGQECHCRDASEFSDNFVAVNPAECRIQCADGLPCGDTVSPRASVYNITGTALASPSPFPTSSSTSTTLTSTSQSATASAAASSSASSTPHTGGSTTSVGSVGGTTTSSVNRSALIGGLVGGLVALSLAAFLILNRWRKSRRLRATPHLEAMSSKAFLGGAGGSAAAAQLLAGDPQDPYLLPNVLPRTPNMIYSVVTPHAPPSSAKDEIPLLPEEVVAVRGYFKDGWAVGTNVNTGATGAFPLGCLVGDEKFRKKSGAFTAPQRVDSVEGARRVMREASRRRRKEEQQSSSGGGDSEKGSIFASLGRASFGRSSSKGSSGYGTGPRPRSAGGNGSGEKGLGGEYAIQE